MTRHDVRPEITPARRTVVAPETTIRGDVSGPIELVVEGVITGDLDVTVLVMEHGSRLEGSVRADTILIKGRVVGDVSGRSVCVTADGAIEGDLSCEILDVHQGARLAGRCSFSSPAAVQAAPEAERATPPTPTPRKSPLFDAKKAAESGDDFAVMAERLSRIASHRGQRESA